MKILKFLFLFAVIPFSAFAQKGTDTHRKPIRPKLVIGIVVDQMRWDYLYRYYDRYKDNGFKRMLNEGFSCDNAYINYVPTVTAIGHSTIYTGSIPAVHGITGNDFTLQATGRKVYCTEDSTVRTVGSTSRAGEMSPRNLLVTTITDELKLATNFRAKVIGVSLKDRGSILPAGHTADAAYWFDGRTGNWITSTYYMETLPDWVKRFNERKLPEKYLKQDWNTLYDVSTYVQSLPDNNQYEGAFSGMTTPTFPVRTSEMFANNYNVIRTTPYGNMITLEMGMAAIEHEQLGQDEITDFLALSFSTPDYVGHKFGINSVEVEDIYLRLDRDLASLFQYVDKKVGKGNYTVFLSADHGAAHNPNFLKDRKIPAGLWSSGQAVRGLNKTLEDAFGVKDLVSSLSNLQVHLNLKAISKSNVNEVLIRKHCVDYLRTLNGVAFVVDMRNIDEASLPALLKERIVNGYHAGRSGVITVILEPGWYTGSPGATGTSHGAWYAYDAHIPLLWMGWGVPRGRSSRRVEMTDISATLARLLHIQEPNGCVGGVITELFKH